MLNLQPDRSLSYSLSLSSNLVLVLSLNLNLTITNNLGINLYILNILGKTSKKKFLRDSSLVPALRSREIQFFIIILRRCQRWKSIRNREFMI